MHQKHHCPGYITITNALHPNCAYTKTQIPQHFIKNPLKLTKIITKIIKHLSDKKDDTFPQIDNQTQQDRTKFLQCKKGPYQR